MSLESELLQHKIIRKLNNKAVLFIKNFLINKTAFWLIKMKVGTGSLLELQTGG